MVNCVCFDSIPKFGDKTKIQVYLENPIIIFLAFDSLDYFLSTTNTYATAWDIACAVFNELCW